MKKSKNEQVQKFLDDMMMANEGQFNILQKLRSIVFAKQKKTDERIMYGGVMFSIGDDYGGVFVRKTHISFEFGKGYAMDDPKQMLEGKGKLRRHLKISSMADIKEKEVAYFVSQAIDL